jgi:hypothetical protein
MGKRRGPHHKVFTVPHSALGSGLALGVRVVGEDVETRA